MAFRPCLTSSPGGLPQCGESQSADDESASRGKRPRTCLSTNNGSISHGKRLQFDDGYKSVDLHTSDRAACDGGVEQTGAASEFDAVVWTEAFELAEKNQELAKENHILSEQKQRNRQEPMTVL
ncbi:hypothetical protein SRHO_G00080710 [Serrasalmus rhombeus]